MCKGIVWKNVFVLSERRILPNLSQANSSLVVSHYTRSFECIGHPVMAPKQQVQPVTYVPYDVT